MNVPDEFPDELELDGAFDKLCSGVVPGLARYYKACIEKGLPHDTATAMTVQMQSTVLAIAVARRKDQRK